MRTGTPLSEIRGLKSLRRNRSGTNYSYTRTLPEFPRKNTTTQRRSNSVGNRSSSSSSGSNSGMYRYTTGSTKFSHSNSQGAQKNNKRTPHDEHSNEGIESMHHSLARSVISAAGRGLVKNEFCPFHNPLFQMRYARLVQDDEENPSDRDDEYEDGFFGLFPGLLIAKHFLRKLMKCLIILFLTLCFLGFLAVSGELYNVSNQHIPQHDAKYASQVNYNHTLVQINERLNLLDSFSNLTIPYDRMKETPFYLDIKLTGSGIVKRVLSECFQLTMACDKLGLRQPNFNEDELDVFTSMYQGYQGKYVNVDISTNQGIQRAIALNLTQSHLADVISTDMLYEGSKLFKTRSHDNVDYAEISGKKAWPIPDGDQKKGRIFTVFVHPILRAIAYYHYIKEATWDTNYNNKIKDMTLLEFASSKYVEKNPMVEMLSNINNLSYHHHEQPSPYSGDKKFKYQSQELDFKIAKHILETKILIGLYRDLDGSISRFQRYFSWDPDKIIQTQRGMEAVKSCKSNVIDSGDKWLLIQGEVIQEGGEIWNKLANSLRLDMQLYKHAEMLYDVQGEKIFGVVN